MHERNAVSEACIDPGVFCHQQSSSGSTLLCPCCFNQQSAVISIDSGELASAPLATGPMWKMCVTRLDMVLVLISPDSDLLFLGSLVLLLHVIHTLAP